jgi:hypothetical protein
MITSFRLNVAGLTILQICSGRQCKKRRLKIEAKETADGNEFSSRPQRTFRDIGITSTRAESLLVNTRRHIVHTKRICGSKRRPQVCRRPTLSQQVKPAGGYAPDQMTIRVTFHPFTMRHLLPTFAKR